VLLAKMVYSEDDLLMYDVEEENEAQPDRPEDVKPRFHKARVVGGGGGGGGGADQGDEGGGAEEEEGEEEWDEDEDDEDDDDDDDEGHEWNLRKCSASSLDVLARNFGSTPEFMQTLLPLLQQKLSSPNWVERYHSALISHACLYMADCL
jgi:transportin-1